VGRVKGEASGAETGGVGVGPVAARGQGRA
jgi:hypothetical protein